ncbi:MAG: cell wall-binding repeat-containing protein [Actinobacteria bacterium]|nr:cell wall-binding repeat-containing protein [Actinomycetota bacterium]
MSREITSFRAVLLVVALAAQLAVTLEGSPAAAADPGRGMAMEDAAALRVTSSAPVRLVAHETTGFARLVGAAPGNTLGRPAGVGASDAPEVAARAFLRRHQRAFGMEDADQDLDHRATAALTHVGGSAVRFDQTLDGIPILGGELVVRTDAANRIVSVAGEILPETDVDVTAAVPADAATATARAAVAKYADVAADTLEASAPELAVFDRALFGGPGLPTTRLVWRTEVASTVDPSLREYVLVDAHRGGIVVHFSLVHAVKQRYTCDNADVERDPGDPLPSCTAASGLFVRGEGDPATGHADVNSAHDHAGGVYDFLFAHFGRDSLNDAGLELRSTVRWCYDFTADPDCPYLNAFWTGAEMYYGTGLAADDIVGHELAHGLTQFTANLFYYYQSGAINESLSDLYGELYDLETDDGDDTPGNRWLVGEDSAIGAIRDMADPPLGMQPDRIGHANYHTFTDRTDPDAWDNGGVHTNSGVNNKAIYLLVDGDTFNGRTITGLGAAKTLQIYYEAQTSLLTSATDYPGLADALEQACDTLVDQHGITVSDCVEVADAVAATEMRMEPAGPTTLEAPYCVTGSAPAFVYQEDAETDIDDWGVSPAGPDSRWYYGDFYATSGDLHFWGDNVAVTGTWDLYTITPISVPADAYLRFAHAWEFQAPDFDGGIVQYSIDRGETWADLGGSFVAQGYNGTIDTGFGNPLAGAPAFVGTSGGYTASVVDLSALASQDVSLRWRIGTDSAVGSYGWFLDDIEIYTCEIIDGVPPEFPVGAALTASGTTGTATTLQWTPATDDVGVDEYRIRRNGTQIATVSGATTTYEATGLTPATSYTFEVVAADAGGNTSGPLEVLVETLDTLAPTFSGGSKLAATDVTTTGLVLSWPEADDNVAVTAYHVHQDGLLIATKTVGQTSHAVSGLDEATAYTFTVVALDDAGNVSSALSRDVTTVDATAPTFPAGAKLEAIDVGNDHVTLAWQAATDNIAVDRYEVVASTVDATATTTEVPASETSATLAGLGDGTTYTFTIRAADAAGNVSDVLATTATTLESIVREVARLAGLNRYETAARVPADSFPDGASTVYVATGINFPDALAAGPVAGRADAPILLVTTDAVPEATATELRRLGPTNIVVLGGDAAVSPGVERQLVGFASGVVTRLQGSNRYETAVEVSASAFQPGVPVAYVATGANFPDALAGAAAAGRDGGPILLVTGDDIPDVVAAELDRLRPGRIVILGGTAAVSDAVQSRLGAFTTGSVTRLEGTDRYATAAGVAATFAADTAVVYVATGANFPDALTGTPPAVLAVGPIVLVPGDAIPADVSAQLDRIRPRRIVVLGGPAVVDVAVESALADFLAS